MGVSIVSETCCSFVVMMFVLLLTSKMQNQAPFDWGLAIEHNLYAVVGAAKSSVGPKAMI